MSQRNVDTVLQVFDAFGRRDEEAMFAAYAPDVEWSPALDPVDLGEKVLITVYDRAQGKGSGLPIERYHAEVWSFRDDLVVRVEIWDGRESALALHRPAAGRGAK